VDYLTRWESLQTTVKMKHLYLDMCVLSMHLAHSLLASIIFSQRYPATSERSSHSSSRHLAVSSNASNMYPKFSLASAVILKMYPESFQPHAYGTVLDFLIGGVPSGILQLGGRNTFSQPDVAPVRLSMIFLASTLPLSQAPCVNPT